VIIDSHLRVPCEARALKRLTANAATTTQTAATAMPHAVVVTLEQTLQDASRAQALATLRRSGVRVLGVSADESGHVCLASALRQLHEQLGIRSVMIEGGASVIGSCARAQLAHRVIVTLAPKTLVNGLRPGAAAAAAPPTATDGCMRRVQAFCLGDDVVVSGEGPAARAPETQLPARL